MSKQMWSYFFDCYVEVFSHREDKKAYKRRKFKDLHQRYKPIAEWLELPFMGRRYR